MTIGFKETILKRNGEALKERRLRQNIPQNVLAVAERFGIGTAKRALREIKEVLGK